MGPTSKGGGVPAESDAADPPRVRFRKTSRGIVARGVIRDQHEVYTDEYTHVPPVGTGEDLHPTPVDLFLSSLVACQLSVLSQTLAKARVEEFELEGSADKREEFDADIPDDIPPKSLIGSIDVQVTLRVPEAFEDRARRCLDVYDQGCIVGQSIKLGVDYAPETTLEVTAD